MKPIYYISCQGGDPWARYNYDIAHSTNKQQLEGIAARINKLDPETNAKVRELNVETNSFNKVQIEQILQEFKW